MSLTHHVFQKLIILKIQQCWLKYSFFFFVFINYILKQLQFFRWIYETLKQQFSSFTMILLDFISDYQYLLERLAISQTLFPSSLWRTLALQLAPSELSPCQTTRTGRRSPESSFPSWNKRSESNNWQTSKRQKLSTFNTRIHFHKFPWNNLFQDIPGVTSITYSCIVHLHIVEVVLNFSDEINSQPSEHCTAKFNK